MRDNWSLSVVGSKVALVPYRKQFVEKYNGMMYFRCMFVNKIVLCDIIAKDGCKV